MRFLNHIKFLSLAILILFFGLLAGCGEKTTGKSTKETTSGILKPESSVKEEGIKEGKTAFVDQGDIWVMDLSSGDRKNITSSPEKEVSPRWSPDGKKIAFTRQDKFSNVYVVNADGSGLTRLTKGTPGNDSAPAWSPDGKRIAFLSTRDRPDQKFFNAEIYLMNPDGSGQARLTHGFELENPNCLWWSPDGSRIAVHEEGTGGGTGISLVNTSTGAVERTDALRQAMKKEGFKFSLINVYLFNPRYPNLIVCSLYDLGKEKGDPKHGLYLFDQSSGSIKKIYSYDATALGWLKDGSSLVYFEKGKIVSMKKEGAEPVMLADLAAKGSGTGYSEIDLYWPAIASR